MNPHPRYIMDSGMRLAMAFLVEARNEPCPDTSNHYRTLAEQHRLAACAAMEMIRSTRRQAARGE